QHFEVPASDQQSARERALESALRKLKEAYYCEESEYHPFSAWEIVVMGSGDFLADLTERIMEECSPFEQLRQFGGVSVVPVSIEFARQAFDGKPLSSL